ncbi:MAG: DUF2784 family protein [Armatimonadetes bacterium]|nr:DUF2784 family protein [Armatimonadota bacterium]
MLGWLADAVAVVHGLLVLAVLAGALLAMAGLLRRHRVWERAYYGLLAVVIAANVLTGDCPLTRWEQGLRNAYQPGSAYCNSFLGHYLPWLPIWALAWIGPVLMGGALLAAPLWRWADRRSHPPAPNAECVRESRIMSPPVPPELGARGQGSGGRRRAGGR